MRNRLVSVLLLSAASAQVAAALEADIIGEARAPDDGRLLYRELHNCDSDGRMCEITYVDPEGETIGFKSLDYSQALPAPRVAMRDLRRGRTMTSPEGLESDVVVDAGFDHFIRERWDALSTGDEVTFPFLVLGRSKPLSMRVESSDGECADDSVCLSVSLDAWWLAVLADPIELEYDSERRLVSFSGLSNIPDENGKGQNVVIRYNYAD